MGCTGIGFVRVTVQTLLSDIKRGGWPYPYPVRLARPVPAVVVNSFQHVLGKCCHRAVHVCVHKQLADTCQVLLGAVQACRCLRWATEAVVHVDTVVVSAEILPGCASLGPVTDWP